MEISSLLPGKHFQRLEALRLRDGSSVHVPLLIMKGSKAPSVQNLEEHGKLDAVCVVAGQHGNEWNGTFVCHELFRRIDASKLKTTLALVPIANPLAFREATRVSAIDNIDMNRTYGAAKKRKPTEHLAAYLYEKVFSKCRTVFDIHSGGPGEYLPFIEVAVQERAAEASELSLNAVLVHSKHSHSLGLGLERSGTNAFTIECGKGKDIDRNACEQVIEVIMRYLGMNGMYPYMAQEKKPARIYRSRVMVASPDAGFFSPDVELGQPVSRGERIGGLIRMFEDDEQDVSSPGNGVVIYLRRELLVSKDESLFHLLVP